MASINGNKKLSIPALSDEDIRKLNKRDRISPCEALQLSTCNGPVLVWDNEDDEGKPFLPVFGYVMGMEIERETGDLAIYTYTPESGNCLPYKRGVPVPVGFLPEMLVKTGERFIVGKVVGIKRDIKNARILTPDGKEFEVELSNIVCAGNVKLGLEVNDNDKSVEACDNG